MYFTIRKYLLELPLFLFLNTYNPKINLKIPVPNDNGEKQSLNPTESRVANNFLDECFEEDWI